MAVHVLYNISMGCLCRRCVVLVQSLYFMGSLSFAVWWNVDPHLCDSSGEKQRCVVLLLKSCLSRGMLIMHSSPWSHCGLYSVLWPKLWLLQRKVWDFCQQMPLFSRDYLLYACFEARPNFFPLNKTATKNEETKQVVTANTLWSSFCSNSVDVRCKAQPASTELY